MNDIWLQLYEDRHCDLLREARKSRLAARAKAGARQNGKPSHWWDALRPHSLNVKRDDVRE